MSDLMLHGILNAPCDPDDFVAVTQLKVAARTASKRIEELESKPTIDDYLEANKEMIEKTRCKVVTIESLKKFMEGE